MAYFRLASGYHEVSQALRWSRAQTCGGLEHIPQATRGGHGYREGRVIVATLSSLEGSTSLAEKISKHSPSVAPCLTQLPSRPHATHGVKGFPPTAP